ncbi:hypothetical protein C477_03589 [Haloterrigena salina JCM 13891]|uniref:Uncharacterized protein n=1 Tax=Haloterrigena salina JCM 13891 TaxID=1227488 RepID=M0CHZ7_9EURY|nr:hypothetical protein [Haloterrigena salina]ELZ22866.1 hypothetical protein C477_03589 [Haloterrigena salina JCM 13891]
MRTVPLDGPSIAVGAYVGLSGYLVGTIVGIDGADTGLLTGCGLVWLIVALAVGSRPALWVSLGSRRLLAVPMVVATGPLLVLVFGTEFGAFDASLSLLLCLCGLAVLGLVIWLLGNGAYAARAAGELRAYWIAKPDPGRRRQHRRWGLLLGLGTVAAFIGTLYGAPSFLLSGLLAAFITMQINARRPREYEACENGLKYADIGTVSTQYLPWERFDGLRETEEAIVLERRWRLDERMAAAEVPPDAREAMRAAVDPATNR